MRTRAGETVDVVYERGGARSIVTLTIGKKTEDRGFLGSVTVGKIGVGPSDDIVNREAVGPLRAVQFGVEETWRLISLTGRFIYQLFTGQESIRQLGGLGSMASVTNHGASNGLASYLHVIGFLSVSIGLINLFPIPILDGGHLVFYALEAVRRKPLGPAAQEMALKIGFALVLALMFIGNWNDVLRMVGRTMGTQ